MKYHGELLTHGWLFHHAVTKQNHFATFNVRISMNVIHKIMKSNMQETTIKIRHKGNKTIIENDMGIKWSWTNVDDITAIASVCFFTLKTRFEQHLLYSDNFEIKFTIDESI